MQVVHKISAPDDENAFVTQRCEALPDFIMNACGLRFIDTELDHRNIGIRKDMAGHGSGSMIESPLLVKADGDRGEEGLNPACKDRITGRWILDLVERGWKSSKIMDCPWNRHHRNGRAGNIPMGRDHQDGAGPR